MERLEFNTDSNLFRYLLSEKIKDYVIENLKHREGKHFKIDFSTGSTGNIDFTSVHIEERYNDKPVKGAMFGIDMAGNAFNNRLDEEELEMILNIPKTFEKEIWRK